MRRLLAVCVVAICSAALVFAEGAREETTAPDAPVQLTVAHVYGPVQEDADFDNLYITKHIEDTFNVDLRFILHPAAIGAERMRLAFASGDLPDWLWGSSAVDPVHQDAIRTGAFVQLDDLIAGGTGWVNNPNWDKMRLSVTEYDGHIYTLPRGFEPQYGGERFFWNLTWMEDLGIEIPRTVEEVEAALRELSQARPDAIMISGMYGHGYRTHSLFMNAFGMMSANQSESLGNHINIIDGKVVFSYAHPNYRPFLEYMNRLFTQGFVDPEYFTQPNAQFVARSRDPGIFLFSAADTALVVGSEKALEWMPPYPLTSDYNPDPWWPEIQGYKAGKAAILAGSPNVEKAWEILDWFGTKEGVLMTHGRVWPEFFREEYVPEGLSRENVVVTNDPEVMMKPVAELTSWEHINTYIAPWGGGGSFGNAGQFIIHKDPYGTLAWDRYRRMKAHAPYLEYRVTDRDLRFSPEETEILNRYEQELAMFMDEMLAKFVIGVEPITGYDDYVRELQRFGLSEVTAVYQAAYDRWEAAR